MVLGQAASGRVAVRMSDAGTLCDGPRGKAGAAMPAVEGGGCWRDAGGMLVAGCQSFV